MEQKQQSEPPLELMMPRLQQSAKLFRCQTGALGDGPHGQRVDWMMTRDDQPLFTIGHYQMPALPSHTVAELFKHPLGFALADTGDFGHKV